MASIVISTQIYANADVSKKLVVALVTLQFLTLRHADASVKELTAKLAFILTKKFADVFALQRSAQLNNTGARTEITLTAAAASANLIYANKAIIGMRMSANVYALQTTAHLISTGTAITANADVLQKIAEMNKITLFTTLRLANASALKILLDHAQVNKLQVKLCISITTLANVCVHLTKNARLMSSGTPEHVDAFLNSATALLASISIKTVIDVNASFSLVLVAWFGTLKIALASARSRLVQN